MEETTHRPSSHWTVAALAAVFVIIVAGRAASGADTAFHFSGPPVDGPFQLLNALRRIAVGQRGGADFQFFHGLGVPYLHYPLFRVFGGDLTASELSRQLIAILAYPGVTLLFFRGFISDWRRVLALSLIVYCISLALPLPTITTPSVSMLGVRSSVATLVPAAVYAFDARKPRAIVVGLVIGGALLLGTEQGLAVLVAFGIVSAIAIWRSADRAGRLRESAATVAVAVATLVVFLLLIGGPVGAAKALQYNFRLVPRDQFWYFGAPASVFAPDWSSVIALMRQMPRIPLAVLLAMLALAANLRRLVHEPDGADGRRHLALGVLALYALISCAAILGIFFDTYVEPCIRSLLLIGGVELDRTLRSRNMHVGGAVRFAAPLVPLAAVSVLMLIARVPSTIGGIAFTLPHLVVDHGVRRQPGTLDPFWSETLTTGQRVFDANRGPDGTPPMLWSTFSGWLEARNAVFNPTSFDYAMHALGPENRAAYIGRFRRVRPRLVQTVLPTYLMAEIWMEQTSWELYEEILRNYRPVAATPWSIFWERLPVPKAAPTLIWKRPSGPAAASVEIPATDQFHGDTVAVLLDVALEYRTHNPLGALPFIGSVPRYFVSVDGAIARFPVTLDPYTTSAHFPVIAERGRNPVLRFDTYSLIPGARFEVGDIRVARVPIDSSNIGWLINLIEEERVRQPLGPGGDSTGRYRWR